MSSVVLEASDRLRVRFTQRDDRWGHAIEFGFANRRLPQLSACTGTADSEDRGDPVYQYLDNLRTKTGGQQTLLMVGKSGSNHWSAAVEVDPVKGTIGFDVACRFYVKPSFIGSRYDVREDPKRSRPTLPHIELPAIDDSFRRVLEIQDEPRSRRVTISALVIHKGPLPLTVRWKYVVSFPNDAK